MSATLNLDEVLSRGVEQILPTKKSLADLMTTKKIKIYLGIDPTGAFLHLGHAVVLRKLQQLASLGHQVILLVGNGTVRIGDPTGRDDSRPMLTDEQIKTNFAEWQQQASKILNFDQIEIRYNGDWLDKLTYADLVQLLAKTTVQQLLERDMFQKRLQQNLPIFGHEIIYPLLQGYDSVAMDVDLEIGGQDQTFNMLMGRTLQKIYHQREKWILATPLIEGLDGRKMSKSFNNYVALTDRPVDVFGKLMSLPDSLIIKYLTVLTDLPLAEIADIEQQIKAGANPINFKKKLAWIITRDLNDEAAANQAQTFFEQAFQKNQLPVDLPIIKIPSQKIKLIELVKLCLPEESLSQHRRLIAQGAVKFMPSQEKLLDPEQQLTVASGQVLKIGKHQLWQIKSEI